MKATRMVALTGLLAISLAGCLPEERIVWATDGSRALVLAGEGGQELFLMDPTGALTAVGRDITAANWMGDSSLVVVRKVTLASWQDAAAVLPAGRQAEIAKLSARLKDDVLAYEGDWDKYRPNVPPDNEGDLGLVLLHLRTIAGDDVQAKLGKQWPLVRDAKVEIFHLATCQAAGSAAMGPTLALALACASPQVSPDGKAISYWGRPIDRAMAENALMVVPLDGGGQRVVAERTSAWSSWSIDGRYLAYAAADDPKARGDSDAPRLGTVSRSMIFDEHGKMLTEDKGFAPEVFAFVMFHEGEKVAYLPDGRILFSSMSVERPVARADALDQMSLFIVAPHQPTLVRALTRTGQGQLVDPFMCFSVSPDGKAVAIQGNAGQVSVAWLQSGSVQVIQAPPTGGKTSRVVPAWRSNSQLSFVAPAGSEHSLTGRSEMVLADLAGQKLGAVTCLSSNWPQNARWGLLEDVPAATQPASRPKTQPATGPETQPTTAPETAVTRAVLRSGRP